ncbi:MAG: acyl-CoA thioesterase [Thermosediminibacterales bacterium]|nr:acyl-CoA thioesterase [Thermosediminibacterales bacterium]MDK2836643.1 acyl-CoA thioesterase [Thermosediminibacterales bacterium]
MLNVNGIIIVEQKGIKETSCMKIVCLGDSLTQGYRVLPSQAWPSIVAEETNHQIINKGISGDTTSGMLSRLYRDVIDEKPSRAILMGGSNDLLWEVPMEVIKTNIGGIVANLHHHNILVIIGIPIPVVTDMALKHWVFNYDYEKVNKQLQHYRTWLIRFAEEFQCGIIDFYSVFYDFEENSAIRSYYLDGVHPTAEGNRIMAEKVIQLLR